MKYFITLLSTWFLFFQSPISVAAKESKKISGDWLVVQLGIIGASSQDILETSMAEVKKQNLQGLIIQLDTPGGALDTTRSMVKKIMDSSFPVIVWIGPNGSRAGSAGAFITMSAHVAAMAPGTNIGAAHPIDASGRDLQGGDVLKEKVMNDTLAFMEAIAQAKGRNIDMARSFVSQSLSITAEEAKDNHVIDLIAIDIHGLMKSIDGKKVSLESQEIVELDTKTSRYLTYELSLRQRLLEILSNPNLFYLLYIAGIIGLGFELTHPGSIFPGVIGAICLILAFIATSVLPVSFGAMALLAAGVTMIIAELFVPSFGALGIGGFIAFVLGSIFLVDPHNEQGLRLGWLVIAPGTLTLLFFSVLIGYLVFKSSQRKAVSGKEALIGTSGEALSDFTNGHGQIRVAGEIWEAELEDRESRNIKKDDRVVVKDIKGLKLVIATLDR